MTPYTFHLVANAHLDPVWLWDAREGLNEGVQTCRTICDLMDADPELTFIRGEVAIYEEIERAEPILFERIRALIEAGRWDVVGATYIQPDTNMPATETLLRQFLRGTAYFQSRFGVRPRIAWSADAFGQSARLPDILAAAGMEGYAFTRPFPEQMPLQCPAFWWQGATGARILTYRPPAGWYGTERDGILEKLDETLAEAAHGGLTHVGVFYGVGNHGGGPTRRQLADIRAWGTAHPEVQLLFSGLHRLFQDVREEVSRKGEGFLNTVTGEIGLNNRGCYTSAARLKLLYRGMESLVSRAETTDAVIAAALGQPPADLSRPWDAVLLNSFHDILPGSSIERAIDEQLDQMGGARADARQNEFFALTALARSVDTTVPPVEGDYPSTVPVLVWNPHPFPVIKALSLEVCLDSRHVVEYIGRPDDLPLEVRGPDGKPLPFQKVATENYYLPLEPFRARVVVQADLPPLGWAVYTLGWVEGAEAVPPVSGGCSGDSDSISNELYSITASLGSQGISILRNNAPLLGDAGLSAAVVEDPYGSWGDMDELPESPNLPATRETWKVTHTRVLESGPERARYWVRLAGGDSWLDLTFSLLRGRDSVDVDARLLWNERSALLKLILPTKTETAEFEIPGGTLVRGPLGEVPGGRWVRTNTLGFASDAIYGFDLQDGVLRASVCRATRYASDSVMGPNEDLWRPALDSGEIKFKFLLTSPTADLEQLASVLAQPPIILPVPAAKGTLPRSGSFAALEPATARLLAFKPADDGNGFILRVQGGRAPGPFSFTWQGQESPLVELGAREIVTWRVQLGADGWKKERVNAVEEKISLEE